MKILVKSVLLTLASITGLASSAFAVPFCSVASVDGAWHANTKPCFYVRQEMLALGHSVDYWHLSDLNPTIFNQANIHCSNGVWVTEGFGLVVVNKAKNLIDANNGLSCVIEVL